MELPGRQPGPRKMYVVNRKVSQSWVQNLLAALLASVFFLINWQKSPLACRVVREINRMS